MLSHAHMNGGSNENRLDQPDCVGHAGRAYRHVLAVDCGDGAVMTDGNKDGDYPAFPITAGNQVYAQGMSLRDWFAGQALTGLIPAYTAAYGSPTSNVTEIVTEAYSFADAMLEDMRAKK